MTYNSDVPIFNILEILCLVRKHSKLTTVNKSCYVLSCRINGESDFFYNNTYSNVKTGDILFIPHGISYSQKCKNEEIICFHLEAYNKLPNEMLIFRNRNSETANKVCNLFRSAYTEWKRKENNYKYKCLAYLYEILSLCEITANVLPSMPLSMRNAVKFLDAHIFDLDLSVEKICKENALSRTYFNKLFKKTYGLTPIKYITNQRIKKAIFLLHNDTYTNEEIAYLCGFGNTKYFYVTFKKTTGKTTKEYRLADN